MADSTLRVRFTANNDSTRQRGLMFAEPLQEDEVALFEFPYSDRFAFWNKNVGFGLTLAFLDENRRLVECADMDAGQEEMVAPSAPIKYVVEAKRGSLNNLDIKPGDIFHIEGANIRVSHGKRKLVRVSKEISN